MKIANNYSHTPYFLLLDFSEDRDLQPIFFGLLLCMYLVTVLGNLLIMLSVSSDSHLHTPMYFFLFNLSLVDICFTSTTIPKMLLNIQMQKKHISYIDCLTQVYFLNTFAGMDNFLLSLMAYDRYVAICRPLNYTVIMNPQFCCLLVLMSWILMFWISLIHILLMKQLVFTIGTQIPQVFCELSQVLKVAQSDTLVNDIYVYTIAALLLAFPVNGILLSYIGIVSTLMRMSSTVSKYKAFSTCGSHLCVVCLFYGAGFWAYLSSSISQSPQENILASMMYTVVAPMLNPFIYSLRNKDVKGALRKLVSRASFS